jgi:sugar phosphate isomerase/epimerase
VRASDGIHTPLLLFQSRPHLSLSHTQSPSIHLCIRLAHTVCVGDQVSRVKRYGARLEAFHFKRVFDERAADVAKVCPTCVCIGDSRLCDSERERMCV